MKKGGVLNPALAAMIASCQHGDKLMVCDSGYPIPYSKKCLDLSVTVNLPRLLDVLNVILGDLQVEGVIVANEMEARSKEFYDNLMKVLPKVAVQHVTHAEFKELAKKEDNILFVRTGEATPFSNVILVSGVIF